MVAQLRGVQFDYYSNGSTCPSSGATGDRLIHDCAEWLGFDSNEEYLQGLEDGSVASLIASEAEARGYDIP